ncbi:MAG TPA: aldehyde dehydrogenase family protein [Anaerolineales bacterium]|nr:aldehyde dehydrogenase family protein [Anaerolineales bacterium]
MTEFDKDLQSIQEARTLAVQARDAQRRFMSATQAEVDRICAAMAQAAADASVMLGKMANEETGYGVPEHKTLKNLLSSQLLWEAIKDIPTVGVIRNDPVKRTYDIAWPMGVIAALTPSTNPTSTTMYKTLIAVKAKNAIIVAPHPFAAKCCAETIRIMSEAGERAGMPKGLISCMTKVSLPGTQELMKHRYVALILATGGSDMVRAAHSVGKPAYGVGPGNVPVYVDRSADLERAAKYIVASKAFDHSVICATEQAVVADRPIAARLEELMKAEGAYFVDDKIKQTLAQNLFVGHLPNPKAVGRSPQQLAQMYGFSVPDWARILVVKLNGVGREEPLSGEKLTTVLGWYEVDGWEAGCERSIDLINYGGRGHSLVIHARDDNIIMRFGLEKPVFRIVVNTFGTLGTTGYTTGVMPSMTLGSGGVGGAITGDNITVHHLYNIKKLAYEIRAAPEAAFAPGSTDDPAQRRLFTGGSHSVSAPAASTSLNTNGKDMDAEVEEIVRRVLLELKK